MLALFVSFMIVGIAGALGSLAVILLYVSGNTAPDTQVFWSGYACFAISALSFRAAIACSPER